MTQLVELDRARRAAALRDWVAKCRDDMGKPHRYPAIEFDANVWPIRTKYKTRLPDINLAPTMQAFESRHESYTQAVRCLTTEWILASGAAQIRPRLHALRLLGRSGPLNLIDLQRSHLQELEQAVLEDSARNPSSAERHYNMLICLTRIVDRLSRVGVIEPSSWSLAHSTSKAMRALSVQRRSDFKQEKASVLDRQIEALSDAMSCMLRGDPRLSAYDHAALAVMGVLMCAPSRVNEPLCMAVDDVFAIEDYTKRAEGLEGSDELLRAHMLLLQKGSKGADWGAKPALNFMLGLLTRCIEILKEGGKRSRMLAEWYEQNPKRLYLPPEIEHFRGQMIDMAVLWQIVHLSEKLPTSAERTSLRPIWSEVKEAGFVRTIPNPRQKRVDGTKNTRGTVGAVAWDDLEPILLRRVHKALESTRRVGQHNYYDGRISKMLMLYDFEETPYLPSSIKYGLLRNSFKLTQAQRDYLIKNGSKPNATIFEKLDLTMVVNGKVEYAWIDSHDPRRWLTTQAMLARERLSDVLINKWANRLSIEQLEHYDLRSDTQKADQSAMPTAVELADISAGLQKIEGIEADFGLKTEIVVAHEAGVSVTSMDAIASAAEDRPVARTSNQIIILYPSRFGACLHQHHETPCRAYTSCLPCTENLVVKGHLPTNEEVRKRHQSLTRSIVRQLERLVTAHNRQIADSPEGLESHMLALVSQGLTAEEMADELIGEFHEIKDRIKSPCLRNRLEEAFVARGMVKRLDDPAVASGALMRYHNPARHASPGHERALEAHGGRAAIDAQLDHFHREHPRFASTSLGLKDERELLEQDEHDDKD